jgi:hypothetical protein
MAHAHCMLDNPATHTHTPNMYAFSRKQWLRERTSMLLLYVHCLLVSFRGERWNYKPAPENSCLICHDEYSVRSAIPIQNSLPPPSWYPHQTSPTMTMSAAGTSICRYRSTRRHDMIAQLQPWEPVPISNWTSQSPQRFYIRALAYQAITNIHRQKKKKKKKKRSSLRTLPKKMIMYLTFCTSVFHISTSNEMYHWTFRPLQQGSYTQHTQTGNVWVLYEGSSRPVSM